jgi:apolipoprotein D and lipocalin family protein
MMKIISIVLTLFVSIMIAQAQENKPVTEVDLEMFSGKWYSLSSMPTELDKDWKKTIENYTLNKKGYYNVNTTYEKVHKGKSKSDSISSRLFQVPGSNNAEMKAQFIWPFKVDYWVIELAKDYSYVVVGHPKKKYLFIMSRKPFMDKVLYNQIVERCANRGYATDNLVFQFDF